MYNPEFRGIENYWTKSFSIRAKSKVLKQIKRIGNQHQAGSDALVTL